MFLAPILTFRSQSMLKRRAALFIVLLAMGIGTAFAGNPASKVESVEAAQWQLEKMCAASGTLDRFEIECLVSDLDNTFAMDERWRLRLYAEGAAGYRLEIRPGDTSPMSARPTKSGQRSQLRPREPETWVCLKETCAVFHESQRSYHTMDVRPKHFWSCLRTVPRACLPPWLDSTIDRNVLKSRFEIKMARSTPTEFFIRLACVKQRENGKRVDDLRLEASHELMIDRRTNLPKKWRMIGPTRDQIVVFERFDLSPAKRDLKIDLTGYQDAQKAAQAAPPAAPTKDDGEPFRTIQFTACCFRVLTWCPF
jgi:hypothetical protein